jgi:hypothetical protein
VAGSAPDSGQCLQLIAVRDHDDDAVLPVGCGRSPPGCRTDRVEVGCWHRIWPVAADVSPGADGVLSFHWLFSFVFHRVVAGPAYSPDYTDNTEAAVSREVRWLEVATFPNGYALCCCLLVW